MLSKKRIIGVEACQSGIIFEIRHLKWIVNRVMPQKPGKELTSYIYRYSCLGLLWAWMLAACVQPGSTKTIEQMSVSTPVSLSWTETLAPTATHTPRPIPSVYFTPTPRPVTPTPSLTPTPVFRMCTPLKNHTFQDLKEIVTQPFDPPPPGKDTGHHGVDFAYYRRGERASILGVKIQSVLVGRVATVVRDLPPYGNMIIIETPYAQLPVDLIYRLQVPDGQSVYLLYAHMNEAPLPQAGDSIACGEALGEVGNTPPGWSSDPHLHLEGRIGPPGVTFSGMGFYDTRASLKDMENYERWRMSGEFQLFDPMILLVYGLSP